MGDYNVYVIDNGNEYECICGKENCRMKKMQNASDYMAKYNTHINKKDFYYGDHNRRAIYYDSDVCKWGINHDPGPYTILKMFRSGYDILEEREGYVINRGQYITTTKLMRQILSRLKTSEKKIISLQYLWYHNDPMIYMSKLPSDILHMILDYV